MLTIETKEIIISEELRKKIDKICRFTNVKPIIVNGNIRSIKNTNIAYVEPHRMIINNNTFLLFDECNDVFINTLYNKIPLKDLERYIKSNNNHSLIRELTFK